MSMAVTQMGPPYVPSEIFHSLSPEKRQEVRLRVLKYTMSLTANSSAVTGLDAKEDLAHSGILWMLRLRSCEYLRGLNGIDTVISLAANGVRIHNAREIDRQKAEYDAVTDQAHLKNIDLLDFSDGNPPDGSEMLHVHKLLRSEIQLTKLQAETKLSLLRIVDVMSTSSEDLYDFDSDGDLRLKARRVGELLELGENYISKRSAQLNEMIRGLGRSVETSQKKESMRWHKGRRSL